MIREVKETVEKSLDLSRLLWIGHCILINVNTVYENYEFMSYSLENKT